jgi:hypothetical protein
MPPAAQEIMPAVAVAEHQTLGRTAMTPPLVLEVLAGYRMGMLTPAEVVLWAVDALVAGADSRSLRMLAGLEPPFDLEEVGRLQTCAFRELQVELPSESEHVSLYTSWVLRSILATRIDRKDGLRRLADLYLIRRYDAQLDSFYRLYHAKRDLEHEEVQFYWVGATSANIDQIIDSYAAQYLKDSPHAKPA